MAISDVLYESAQEIREYMREMPEAYEPMKARLQRLLGNMDRIRNDLDTLPEADRGSHDLSKPTSD